MDVLATQPPVTGSPVELHQELETLVSGCAIYPLDQAQISLAGRDRVRWLNGMITNNVRNLQPAHGVYAFFLNPQGHILADLYAFQQGERIVLETDRGQLNTLRALIKRYIIMDQVEVEDWSEKFVVFGVTGKKALALLNRLSWTQELAPLEFGRLCSQGGDLSVVRTDNPYVPSYELWIPRELAPKLWETLERAGGQVVHEPALDALRVVCGIPKFGQDIRSRDLPQETGQLRALNFNKGCYIGQEIVERIRSRGAVHRTFIGFEVEGERPAASAKVQSDDKEVGEITSSVVIATPGGERILAAGYLRKEFMASEKELKAGTSRLRARTFPLAEFLVSQ